VARQLSPVPVEQPTLAADAAADGEGDVVAAVPQPRLALLLEAERLQPLARRAMDQLGRR
jgi:hypothetical protein